MLEKDQIETGTFLVAGTEGFWPAKVKEAFDQKMDSVEIDLWLGEQETIINNLRFLSENQINEGELKLMVSNLLKLIEKERMPRLLISLADKESLEKYKAFEITKMLKKSDTENRIDITRSLLNSYSTDESKSWFDIIKSQFLKSKDNYDYLLIEGDIEYNLLHYRQAIELFKEFLSKKSDNVTDLEEIKVYEKISGCYKILNEFDLALEFAQESVDKKIRLLGDKSHELCKSYHLVADIHSEMANFPKTLEYLNMISKIIKTKTTNKDLDIAELDLRFGKYYLSIGHFEQSIIFFQKAHENFVKVLGGNHFKVAATFCELGLVYHAQDNTKKALEYMKKAFEMGKSIVGEDHTDICRYLEHMAMCYFLNDSTEKALEIQERCLAIKKKVYGEMNLSVANAYFKISSYYVGLQYFDHAREFCQKSLEIIKTILKEDHVFVLLLKAYLAIIYSFKGMYNESEDLFSHIFSKFKDQDLSQRPNFTYIDVIQCYGYNFKSQQKFAKALEQYELAKKLKIQILGESSFQHADTLCEIGEIYLEIKDFSAAKEKFTEAFELRKKIFGDETFFVSKYQHQMAEIQLANEPNESAVDYLQVALETDKELFGENSIQVAKCYMRLYMREKEKQKIDTAFQLLEKAHEIKKLLHGEKSCELFDTTYQMASLLISKKKVSKGVELLENMAKILIDKYGPKSNQVILIYKKLAEVESSKKEVPEAKALLMKALEIELQIFADYSLTVALTHKAIADNYATDKAKYQIEYDFFYEKALEIIHNFYKKDREIGFYYSQIVFDVKDKRLIRNPVKNHWFPLKINYGSDNEALARFASNLLNQTLTEERLAIAKAFKEIGKRYMVMKDLARAKVFFQRALEEKWIKEGTRYGFKWNNYLEKILRAETEGDMFILTKK